MQPWMRDDEIASVRALLDEQKEPLRVLEWGCGGSTVTFSCHENVAHWTSIENDEGWYVKVRRLLDSGKGRKISDKITLRLATTEEAYLTEPYGNEYDMIFVDGRWRNECLDIAPQYLASGGFVLIHDCDRVRYQPSMDAYPERKRLSYGDKRHQGLMLLRPGDDTGIDTLEEMSMSELREMAERLGIDSKRSKEDQISAIIASTEWMGDNGDE